MNRKVLLIAAGTAVALVAVWFLLLWSPQGQKLDAARERQAEAEEANSALALRIERLRDLRARRPELEADRVALRSAVPESPELDDFLLDTDAAADRSGVDITSVSPGKPAAAGDDAAGTTAPAAPAPAPAATAPAATDTAGATAGTPPSAISLSLDASGGYFQILDFINRLDDLPRIVVVDSLSLSGGGSGDASASGTGDTAATGGTSSSELTMSITARMFTTAPPAPPEGEAAEAGGATTTTTTTAAPSGATAGGAGQ